MMNKYRVDRAMEAPCSPVGMNSILYIGESYVEATKVYIHANGGKDAWNQPHCLYGVMLSIWNPDKNEYMVKRWKK